MCTFFNILISGCLCGVLLMLVFMCLFCTSALCQIGDKGVLMECALFYIF